jgi:hypothetical protein
MADKLDGGAIVANTIPGTKIQSGTITTTQLAPAIVSAVTVPLHPKISSITYPGNDTAANTGGGDSIIINGSGFGTNVQVYINGTAAPSVTRNNANAVTITTAAQSAGTYLVYLINTDDGGTAILVPGIQYSGMPTWVTASPLNAQQALSSWSISLSATGDTPITYSLQAGSSLPAGITLAANGLISGTMTSPPENDTTYNFTVVATDPQSQDTPKAFSVSVTVVVDTQFQYTTLLLQADGTNNGNNHAFLDSSNNNFTITRNGNAAQGSFTPFSPTGWSNYFDGGSGTNLSLISSSFTALGTTGTVEGWWYFTRDSDLSGTSNKRLYATNNATDALDAYFNNNRLYFHGNSVNVSSMLFYPNQWYHIAVVYNAGAMSVYVNGIQQTLSGTTTGYNITSQAGLFINSFYSSGYEIQGYLSNFRIVKGTAVYTSSFTPSTTPITAVANTVLLTCQSNRFRDATSAKIITPAGGVSVQTFTPFATTTAYSPATHGGSAYFDGAGDYLDLPANSAFNFGTGDFTIDFWLRTTTTSSDSFYRRVYMTDGPAGNGDGTNLQISMVPSSGYIELWNGTTEYIANTNVCDGAWHHIAATRSSGTMRLFVDGLIGMSTTYTNGIGTTTNSGSPRPRIASYDGSSGDFEGYISGLRVIKGIALYTANTTVPTSPPSNVANTSLLCNFTNAQIYDAAAGAILETVGDAKVNTAIKKYGAGSIAFDGTGDYLKAPSSELGNFGTGDFTIEMWAYFNNTTDSGGLGAGLISNPTGTYATIYSSTNNGSTLTFYNGSGIVSGTIRTSTWQHIAVARSGSTLKMFIDGVQTGSATHTSAVNFSSNGTFIGSQTGSGGFLNGYIDDLRISKGLARYRYNFTPPTRAFPTKSGTAPAATADEDFEYTTLLLPGNGTNNQNNHTFLDSSNNNFVITRNGNSTQGTFSPFSQTGWSAYFDGTGDYLTTNATQAIPATGDFTIEAWVYPTASGPGRTIVSQGTSGSSGRLQLNVHTDNTLQFGITSSLVYSTGKVAPNFWNHIAVTRTGSSVTFYINGANAGTATLSGTVQNTALWIGAEWSGDPYRWLGYISNVRISNVIRTITSAPTAAFTSDANTVLLACQSNRFIDNSSNAYTITRAGDISVQAFSPFAPTASYAAANVGGSGYFDGNDKVLVATNSNMTLGTSDFTVELWAYPLTLGGARCFTTQADPSNDNQGFWIGSTDSNLYCLVGDGSWVVVGSSGVLTLNAWQHIALSRSGSTFRLFLNGALVNTQTSSISLTNTNNAVAIGGRDAGASQYSHSYISGLRVLRGTSLYTAAFTPPTSPPTAIANTQLLTNFTNAGITDATAKNILETVGDAKISTAQNKFGGSSMLFDGSGDRLTIPFTNDLLELGINGQNFTVEAWVYPTNAMASAGQILSKGGGAASWSINNGAQYQWTIFNSAASWNFNSSGSSITVNSGTVTLNAWQHLAVTYDGTTTRTFLNGLLQSTSTSSYTAPSTRNLQYIGMTQSGGFTQEYYGYINDLRITKGIARYTQNFTPPTTAFLTK